MTGQTALIGQYLELHNEDCFRPNISNRMTPVPAAFREIGVSAIERAIASDSEWVLLDELGYLENCCIEFQEIVQTLFEKKRVIAVLRKQSTPFLNTLSSRKDAFLYDLDSPVLPVGCVIMASGLGKRFGSNKLMENVDGKPMISHILDITGENLFAARIVVTRHESIQHLCQQRNIPVVLHKLDGRNDTIRLGLMELIKQTKLSACVFAASDQPLLTRESLETLLLTHSQRFGIGQLDSICADILRLCWNTNGGNPVLFGNQYFDELLHLPKGKGGGVVIKNHHKHVIGVEAGFCEELFDVDTPKDLDKIKNGH